MPYQVNDWVEIRSKEEILSTLDQNGRLEGLPFMPQMFAYCGKHFKIYKNAHKTCDTVSGKLEIRKIPNTVHLDIRCDGKAYGGCQANCLIFWKEAWLKPADTTPLPSDPKLTQLKFETNKGQAPREAENNVWNATRAPNSTGANEIRYSCQATELMSFSASLKWWDPRQYVTDYRSGNATTSQIASAFLFFVYRYGTLAKSERFGRPARWLYDRIQFLRGGTPYPRRKGTMSPGKPAPNPNLNLRPGELVRIKQYPQILETMSGNTRHLGLDFDAEMVPYCGRTYQVRARVQTFIDERTGLMKTLKTPAIILEGVICMSRYSGKRIVCPRSIYPWWREAWLERVYDADNLQTPLNQTDNTLSNSDNKLSMCNG